MDKDDSNSDSECTPPEIVEAAKITCLKILPTKSRARYERTYEEFINWRKGKDIKSSFSENVLLAYMDELSKKVRPNTLWSIYSMLRTTLYINHNVDIAKYLKIKAFLKRKNDGYKPKKSSILTTLQINDFITQASDDQFLFSKVSLKKLCRYCWRVLLN